MKFENTKVYNIARAVYSARNAMESWDRSDSDLEKDILGENDLKLAQSLIKAGSEHRKFMRQIFVTSDWTAPLYLWKEIDQYRIGVTTNSCSTMHKLASTPITIDCFEMGDYERLPLFDNSLTWKNLIFDLERLRKLYNETKDKRYWKELIRLLPESWLQKRTITMSYENVLNMVRQRKNHKLREWSVSFVEWARTLPYSNELIFIDKENKNDTERKS